MADCGLEADAADRVEFGEVCRERESEGIVGRFFCSEVEVLWEADCILCFLVLRIRVKVRQGETISELCGGDCCVGVVFHFDISAEVCSVEVEGTVFGIEVFGGELVVGIRCVDLCAFQRAGYLGRVCVVVDVCMRDAVYFQIEVIVVGVCAACGCSADREGGCGFFFVGGGEGVERNGIRFARVYLQGDGFCDEHFAGFLTDGEVQSDIAQFGDCCVRRVVLDIERYFAEGGYDRCQVEGRRGRFFAQCGEVERRVVFKEEGAGGKMVERSRCGLFECKVYRAGCEWLDGKFFHGVGILCDRLIRICFPAEIVCDGGVSDLFIKRCVGRVEYGEADVIGVTFDAVADFDVEVVEDLFFIEVDAFFHQSFDDGGDFCFVIGVVVCQCRHCGCDE